MLSPYVECQIAYASREEQFLKAQCNQLAPFRLVQQQVEKREREGAGLSRDQREAKDGGERVYSELVEQCESWRDAIIKDLPKFVELLESSMSRFLLFSQVNIHFSLQNIYIYDY